MLCIRPTITIVNANEYDYIENITIATDSVVNISESFGIYQTTVDENIYYSLSSVNDKTLVDIYGDYNTPMFIKAKETINPCMALATTWGEAGESYKGVSLTTVMDFNPDTYNSQIDWITVTRNLEQVDSMWYLTNATNDCNSNAEGKAYNMPNALLQFPKTGTRETSAMIGLGVGPYQVTSPDWDEWDLDDRVNPIWGYEASLRKCGTSWITCGINPISDLTVYACLSLGHQGGGLITMDFGKNLINILNDADVQESFNRAGMKMFKDAESKALTRNISLADINVTNYLNQIESETGIDFSNYTGGVGSTNKGDYVAKHLLRYCFYKYYYMSGV